MKPTRSNPLFARYFIAGFASVIVVSGNAAEIPYKSTATSTADVGLNTNWQGDVLPGAGDIAAWTTAGGGGESRGGALTIPSPVSWQGLRYEDSAGPITLSGSDITLGSSGITEVRWELFTVNNNIILGADQTWAIGGSTTTLNGTLTGSFTLTKAGGAALNFTNSALGGGLFLAEGGNTNLNPATLGSTVTVQEVRSRANVNVGNGGLLNVLSGNFRFNTAGGGYVQASGTGTTGRITSSTGTLDVSSVDGTGTITTGSLTAVDHRITLPIVDFDGSTPLALVKSGSNPLLLSSVNTHTGGTTINGGRINADNVSCFGTGAVTVNAGGQAWLTQTAAPYASNFTIAGTGPTEVAGNLGALRFNGGNTASGTITVDAGGARITAYGTAVGTISGSLAGSGALEINSPDASVTGTINLTGDNSAFTAPITVAQGRLNVNSALGSSVTVTTGTLGVTGSIAGNATVPDLGILTGEGTITGTLNLGDTLGSTLQVQAATTGALTVGTLNLTGNTLVNLDSLPTGAGPFTIVNYTTLGTGDETNFSVASGLYRNPQFANDTINKKITLEFETGTRTWNGTASTDWNVTDTNWDEGDNLFTVGDSVVFTDNGVGEVFLVGTLAPTSITLSNTVTNNYIFTPVAANNYITGSTGITMGGGGNLTLGGVAGQNYTGAVNVNAGILTMAGQYALGQTSGVTVASGAQVNLNGQSAGALASGGYSWTIAGDGGDGADGVGAITNSGAAVFASSGIKSLTLSANAEIGGSNGRFDVGRHEGTGTYGTINGGGFTLTKVGTNAMVFRAPASNISYVLNAGSLTFEDFDTASGISPITVNAGTLGTYNNRTIPNDVTFVNSGSTLTSQFNTGTWTGALTLNGDTTFSTAGNLAIDGSLAGSGNITRTGGNVLALQNSAASFSGKINNTAGTLRVEANAALGTATGADVITMGGGTTLQGGTIAALASATVGGVTQGITQTGAVTYDAGAGNTLTVGAPIIGTGDLVKANNTGNVTFNGDIATNGNMQGNGGTMTIGAGLTLTDGVAGVLRAQNSNNLTFGATSVASTREIQLGTSTMNIGVGANVSTTKFITSDGGGNISVINQTGGTFNVTGTNNSNNTSASFLMGHWGYSSASNYNLSGGTLNAPGAELSLGWDSSNVHFNQSGGTANFLGIDLANGRNNGGTDFNLTGGRMNLGINGITNATNKAVNLGGGTVGAFGSWSSAKNITFTGTGGATTFDTLDSVDSVTARSITLTGALSGVGNIIKTGAGNLALNNATATYTGTIEVQGGTLMLNSNAGASATVNATTGAVQPGTVVAAGTGNLGTLNLLGGSAAFRVGTATDLLNVTNFTVTNPSTITGIPGNAITGSFPQTFTVLDYTGVIGGLDYAGLSYVSANPHIVGQLVHDVPNTQIKIQIDSADSVIWKGNVDGNWNVNFTSNWVLGSDGTTSSKFYDFDVVKFDDVGIGTPTVTLNGTIQPATLTVENTAGTYTLQGTGVTGGTSLVKNNAGSLILLNNNTYSGATTINDGAISVGNGGTAGTIGGSGTIVLGAATASLTMNRSDAQSLTRAISGTGSLIKEGTGTLSASAALPTNLVINDGTVSLTGGGFSANRMEGNGVVTVNSPGILLIPSGAAHAIGGNNATMTESLVVNGGTATFNSEQYFALMTLNGALLNGTNEVRATNAATNFQVIGTLASTINCNVNHVGNANWNVADVTSSAAADLVINGNVTNAGALVKTGAGTIKLAGLNNTFTGGTAVNGGVVEAASVADAGGLASIGTGYLAIANDGLFRYTGITAETTARALWMDQGTQVRTIEITDAAGSIDFTGVAGTIDKPFRKTGAGGLTIADEISVGSAVTVDAGSLTLGGTNTYTGDTTVNGGILVVDGDSLEDTSKLVIDGGVVNVTGIEVVGSLFYGGVQQIDGTYGSTASSATFKDDTRFSGTGVIQVTAPIAPGYDTWALQIPDIADRDRTDDPDGDGYTNIQEFLFGTSPIASNGSLVSSTASGGNLVLRWQQRETGSSYSLLESTTLGLGSWTAVVSPVPAIDVDQTGALTDYDFFKVTIPIGSGKNFYRIEGVEN